MNVQEIMRFITNKEYKELKKYINDIHAVDIASLFEEMDDKQVLITFRLLGKELAAETFTHMDNDSREKLIGVLNEGEIREVMEEIFLDDAVDIIEDLPANVVDRLLANTDDEVRIRINELLNYPEDSAGSIMTVEYIGLSKEMTVKQAIKKIRQVGIAKETIYTCYVTERRHLLGYIALKDLLAANNEAFVEDIMDENVFFVKTSDDQEDVAKLTRKYGLFTVPVVDGEHCLVGIVTVDDAMMVIQEEITEDINKMAAMLPLEESYFETSIWQHALNRLPWLLFLMLSATVTGLILTSYDAVIKTIPIVVAFVPMLMGTGGNCGSQTATLVIRGLAVDEIRFNDWMKILFVEIRVAMGVSAFLAIINGLRIYWMYGDLWLACVLSTTLIATIIMSKIIGCMLPLGAAKIKLDPAIMASPLITTIVDSGSILIYFVIITRSTSIF